MIIIAAILTALILGSIIIPSWRWAVYGNDEDGPYGRYEHTWTGAVKWWLRNPFHNLMFHVLVYPGGPFYEFGDPKGKGFQGYIGFRTYRNCKGVFGIALRYRSGN